MQHGPLHSAYKIRYSWLPKLSLSFKGRMATFRPLLERKTLVRQRNVGTSEKLVSRCVVSSNISHGVCVNYSAGQAVGPEQFPLPSLAKYVYHHQIWDLFTPYSRSISRTYLAAVDPAE